MIVCNIFHLVLAKCQQCWLVGPEPLQKDLGGMHGPLVKLLPSMWRSLRLRATNWGSEVLCFIYLLRWANA